ncbi:iron utilization protein [Prevotella fusca]
MKRTYIPPKIWEVLVVAELPFADGSTNDHADSKENPMMYDEYEDDTYFNPPWKKVKGVWDE